MADEIGTYLGQKGYSIYKECLSAKKALVERTAISATQHPQFTRKSTVFYLSRISPKNIYSTIFRY